ncbi:MAG: cytidine deaminase [Bacteroidetes bacterium]|nr:cytidine deaminase [Bacteroidota bacterium]
MKDFARFKQLEDLDSESKYLVHKAKEATTTAYAPYSKFHVGAAALLEDGTLVTGSNQENASYPLCLCAERIVLHTCATQHPGKAVKKLAVVAHRKNHKELTMATPCGACRQVMLETEVRQGGPMEIVMLGPAHQWTVCPSAESLLPLAFTPNHLHE